MRALKLRAEFKPIGELTAGHSDQKMCFDLLRFSYFFLITCTANLPEYGATSSSAKMASNGWVQRLFFCSDLAHKCHSRGTAVWKGLQCLHRNLPASSSRLALPLHLPPLDAGCLMQSLSPYTSAWLSALPLPQLPQALHSDSPFSLVPPTRNKFEMYWTDIW